MLTRRHDPGPRARNGFTLIEMMVAIVVLSVGVLALASTSSAVLRQMSLGARQSIAARVAQSRFEWMRTRTCAQLGDSTTTTRGITETWTMTTGANSTKTATLTIKIPGRRSNEAYKTSVVCG